MKGKDCVVINRSIVGASEMLQRGRVVRQVQSLLSTWRSESTSLPTYLTCISSGNDQVSPYAPVHRTDAFAARYITVHASIFIKARTLPRV